MYVSFARNATSSALSHHPKPTKSQFGAPISLGKHAKLALPREELLHPNACHAVVRHLARTHVLNSIATITAKIVMIL